jgi:hypothetical protein
VDESGRPTEPPANLHETGDEAADGGKSATGQPEPGSPYALGYRSALEVSGAAVADGGTGGVMSNGVMSGGSAAGGGVMNAGATSGGSGSDGNGTGDLFSGAAATLGEKLGSGRQAMRQAVTATNGWLASRVAKSESSAATSSSRSAADNSVADDPAVAAHPEADGRRVPSFTATAATAASAASAAGAATPAAVVDGRGSDGRGDTDTGGGVNGGGQDPASRRSLWRDSYTPQESGSRPASPWSQSYGAAPDVTSPGLAVGEPGSGWPGSGGPGTGGPGTSGPAAGGPGAGGNGAGGFPPGGGQARAAASAAGAGLAGYAGSVTAAWQNRSASSSKSRESARRNRRQAHLTLARVEPWSVMKFSFVVSVVAFIILFVAVAVLYTALSSLGVFTSLQHTVSSITSSQNSAGTDISTWFSASRILGYTGLLGALNIVLITALSTIGAVVYNLISHTIGGIEVTLRETE